jgi:hypothetical protein
MSALCGSGAGHFIHCDESSVGVGERGKRLSLGLVGRIWVEERAVPCSFRRLFAGINKDDPRQQARDQRVSLHCMPGDRRRSAAELRCAGSAHSNTPGIDTRHSISKLKSKCLTKLMCQRLEVAAQSFLGNGLSLVLAKAGSQRVEDAALGTGFLQNSVATDFRTEVRNVLNRLTIYWGMV